MYLVIELSNTKVKATLVSAKTKAVKQFVARDLGEEVVQNGYINKPEELESTLRLTLTDFPKTKGCVFLLNTTDILQKELVVPAAKPAAVKTVVQNQMNAIIGTGKEYSIDYVVKETFQDAEGVNFQKVFAYAAPVQLLQAYTGIAKNLSLKLVGIDVQHSAFNKAIAGATVNNIPLQEGTSLMMSLGHDAIQLFLIENGQCTYSRNVDFNTEEYLEALRQIDPNASFENISLNPAYAAQFGRYQTLLDPMAGSIVDEIFRMQQYTYSRQEIQPIKNVFVMGQLAQINGMIEYLNANVDVPVQFIQSISTLLIEGEVSPADALIPSGAAEIKNTINLAASIPGMFDDVKVGTGNELKVMIPLGIAIVAVIVGVYLFFLLQNQMTIKKTNDINNALTEPSYVQALAQAQQLQKDKSTYDQNFENLKSYLTEFDENYLYKKSTVYDILYKGAQLGVSFVDLSYADGELVIFCQTGKNSESLAPEYAKELRKIKPAVHYVTYSGEKLESIGEEVDENGVLLQAGEEYYTFELTIGLKEKVIETSETTVEATQAASGESENVEDYI